MKNKLGIILVLGIVAVFDTTNAMDKEDPFAHLDPLKTEQEVRDILKEKQSRSISKVNHSSIISIQEANKDDFLDLTGSSSDTSNDSLSPKPKNRSAIQSPNDFETLRRELGFPEPQPLVLENRSNLPSQGDFSDSPGSSSNTSSISFSSVSESSDSGKTIDASKSSLLSSKFIITRVPANHSASSGNAERVFFSEVESVALGNSMSPSKQSALKNETRGKSASLDFSSIKNKNRFNVSIEPANYPNSQGSSKQESSVGRFKFTRSPAANPK